MSCPTLYDKTVQLAPDSIGRSDLELKCIGAGLTLDELKTLWRGDPASDIDSCNRVFNKIIYAQNPNKREYNQRGFEQVMDDFEYLLSSFFNKTPTSDGKGGHTITVPGQAGYDSFQDILLDACTNPDHENQGACQLVTKKLCSGCPRSEVNRNSSLLRFCGCEVPPLDPAKFGGITRECDPLCSQALISKVRDVTKGTVQECNASICVINNVSIEASKSTVGGISFTQVCPQCSGSQQCKCIVDTTIPTMAESVGITDQVTFRQYCGTNSVCLQIDNKTQSVTEVQCQNAIKPLQAKTFNFPVSKWFWMIAVLIIVVGILMLYSSIHSNHHYPETSVPSSSLPRR